MKMWFLFVEGPDDERFFRKIINDELNIIKYAKEKKGKIDDYIKSIKGMSNADYFLIGDVDLKTISQKKDELLKTYPSCECEKIIICVKEIESWYLAGISYELINGYNIKEKKVINTDNITKEMFDNLIPSRLSRINFMAEILEEYDIENAMYRNATFKYFLNVLESMGLKV